MNKNTLEVAYYLLQDKYLISNGLKDDVKEVLESNLFPDDWFTAYGLEGRVELISLALKENKTVLEVLEEQKNKM